jgi:hypothetical protein
VVVPHVGVVSREWGDAKVGLLVSSALKFASCFREWGDGKVDLLVSSAFKFLDGIVDVMLYDILPVLILRQRLQLLQPVLSLLLLQCLRFTTTISICASLQLHQKEESAGQFEWQLQGAIGGS